MGELLLRKALLVRDRIAKIRAALPAQAEAVRGDDRLEAYLSFNLFLMIQDAVDLATHLVAARGLGVPGSQREAFELLVSAHLLSPEIARAMAALASLRNRIAHSYGEIDPVRMAREAPAGLQTTEAFLSELTTAIAAK